MNINEKLQICVDFDGTCVKHRYPEIGEDVPFAVETLKELVASGSRIILFTMRSGDKLIEAAEWFASRNIKLYGIQSNLTQKKWTDSPKAYGQLYIDDAALGCPLLSDNDSERDFVDWLKVREYLFESNVLIED